MAATMQSLGIDQWGPDERLKLAVEIWQSLENFPEGLLTPDQWIELRKRLEDDERDPNAGSPWEEVYARLMNDDEGP